MMPYKGLWEVVGTANSQSQNWDVGMTEGDGRCWRVPGDDGG